MKPQLGVVCIIGAGVSGLRAASILAAKNYKVIILEARDRIGGRIWSHSSQSHSPSQVLDLGASWLHGSNGNPVMDLAREHGLELVRTHGNYNQLAHSMRMADLNRCPISPDIFTKCQEQFDALIEELCVRYRGVHPALSFSDALARFTTAQAPLSSSSSPLLSSPPSSVKPGSRGPEEFSFLLKENALLFHWLVFRFEQYMGAPLAQLSVRDYDTYVEFQGGNFLPKKGYQQIIDILAAKSPTVRLGHAVYQVNYGQSRVGKEQVIVSYQSPQGQGQIEADWCILSVPLGVLKASITDVDADKGTGKSSSGKIKFIPMLPSRKIQSIQRLGFGLINKIVLRFSQQLPWAHPISSATTNNKDSSRISTHPSPSFICTTTRDGRFYFGLDFAPWGHHSILLFSSVQFSREMESLSDEAVLKLCLESLSLHMRENVKPSPVEYKVTRWGSDPFARGSYTCITPECSIQDVEEIAKPEGVSEEIIFCGEHTDSEHYSTVAGAFLSGERAANHIITRADNLIKQLPRHKL